MSVQAAPLAPKPLSQASTDTTPPSSWSPRAVGAAGTGTIGATSDIGTGDIAFPTDGDSQALVKADAGEAEHSPWKTAC